MTTTDNINQSYNNSNKHECNLTSEHNTLLEQIKLSSCRKYIIPDVTSRLTHQALKSQAAINSEILRHYHYFYYTIHPFSKLRKYWEYIMIITYIVYFYCIPYHIAFIYKNHEEMTNPTAFVELITDFIFMVEIFMNFFTGYHDKKTNKIILSLNDISKEYMKFHFWIDLITCHPNNGLYLILPKPNLNDPIRTINDCLIDTKYYQGCLNDGLDIIKTLKITRFGTLIIFINNFFRRNKFRNFHFKITKLFMCVIFVFHFLTCFQFLLERILHGHEITSASRVDPEELESTTSFELYLHALYRSFYLLGMFGYSMNEDERTDILITSTISILIGYVMTTYLMAQCYILVQIISSPSMKFQKNRYQLQEYMRLKRLPTDIQNRLLNYYDYRLQKRLYKESEIQSIMGPKLQAEVTYEVRRNLLKNVDFIRILPEEVIHKIATILKAETFLKNDIVLRPGQDDNCMHLISSGTLAVYSIDGDELKHYEDGSYFGHMCLFDVEQITKFTVAIEISELYYLEKKDFVKIMSMYPEHYSNARLIAFDALDLNHIFETLIELVIPRTSGSNIITVTSRISNV